MDRQSIIPFITYIWSLLQMMVQSTLTVVVLFFFIWQLSTLLMVLMFFSVFFL